MKTYKMKINGNAYEVAVKNIEGTNVEVEVNGKAYNVELEQPAKPAAPAVARPVARPAASTVSPSVSALGENHAPENLQIKPTFTTPSSLKSL